MRTYCQHGSFRADPGPVCGARMRTNRFQRESRAGCTVQTITHRPFSAARLTHMFAQCPCVISVRITMARRRTIHRHRLICMLVPPICTSVGVDETLAAVRQAFGVCLGCDSEAFRLHCVSFRTHEHICCRYNRHQPAHFQFSLMLHTLHTDTHSPTHTHTQMHRRQPWQHRRRLLGTVFHSAPTAPICAPSAHRSVCDQPLPGAVAVAFRHRPFRPFQPRPPQ